uniref:Uncharacterized protein n=1 Tax=Mus musculus TaxID=10090 RepID=Q8CEA2_MOUSE|nr:unnamed protein product [Mus musculus]
MLPSTAVKSSGKLSTGCPAPGSTSARCGSGGGGGGWGGWWPRRLQVFLPSLPPTQCSRPSSSSTRTSPPMAMSLRPVATCGERTAVRRQQRGAPGQGARKTLLLLGSGSRALSLPRAAVWALGVEALESGATGLRSSGSARSRPRAMQTLGALARARANERREPSWA